MRVFISWSGSESKQIAQALRDWLPMMFESVEPYMSDRDNEAGVRWGDVIATQLDESAFGILCLTPTNLTAPWLLFEAGALGKSVDASRVVPLLWRVSTADVTSPLNQFHMKSANKAGIQDVVRSINAALEKPRPDEVLTGTFDGLWPRLEGMLGQVKPPTAAESAAPHRSDRALLEEILEIVRSARQEAAPPASLSARLRYDSGRARRRDELLKELSNNLSPPGFDSLLEVEGDTMTLTVMPPSAESASRWSDFLDDLRIKAEAADIRLVLAPRQHDSGQPGRS